MIVMMLCGRAPTEIVCTLKDLSRVKIAEEYLKTFQHFRLAEWIFERRID